MKSLFEKLEREARDASRDRRNRIRFILFFKITSVKNPKEYVNFEKPFELRVARWLRCCATNQKVAGSIPDGVIGIFH